MATNIKSKAFNKHIQRVRKEAGLPDTPILGLTKDKAAASLYLYENVTNMTQIAKFFHVSRPTISDVINKKTYTSATQDSNRFVDRFNSGVDCGE